MNKDAQCWLRLGFLSNIDVWWKWGVSRALGAGAAPGACQRRQTEELINASCHRERGEPTTRDRTHLQLTGGCMLTISLDRLLRWIAECQGLWDSPRFCKQFVPGHSANGKRCWDQRADARFGQLRANSTQVKHQEHRKISQAHNSQWRIVISFPLLSLPSTETWCLRMFSRGPTGPSVSSMILNFQMDTDSKHPIVKLSGGRNRNWTIFYKLTESQWHTITPASMMLHDLDTMQVWFPCLSYFSPFMSM